MNALKVGIPIPGDQDGKYGKYGNCRYTVARTHVNA